MNCYRQINVVNESLDIVVCLMDGLKYSRKKVQIGYTFENKESLKKRGFEFTVLQTLQNPFILPIKQHFIGEKDRHGHSFHIVITEWKEQPTLEQLIKNNALTKNDITRYFAMICLAIEETHDKNRVHGNISSAHIYVDEENKLVQLGHHENLTVRRWQNIDYQGERFYLAPEMQNKTYEHYGKEQDIWALGMLLLEMGGEVKKPEDKGEQGRVVKGKAEVVRELLQKDPQKRPVIHKILVKPGIIDELKKLESSKEFHERLKESFVCKIDLGWYNKKNAEELKRNREREVPENLLQKYFSRIGINFRMAQFKIGMKEGEEREAVLGMYGGVIGEVGRVTELLGEGDEGEFVDCEVGFMEYGDFPSLLDLHPKQKTPATKKVKHHIELLEKKLISDPFNSDALIDLAALFFRNKLQEERIEALLVQATGIDVGGGRGHQLLAEVYFERGRFQEALREVDVSLGSGVDVEKYFLKGKINKSLKRTLPSIVCFEKCLKLNIDHYGATIQLANIFLEYDLGECAFLYYQSAVRIRPESVSANYGLIVALKRHTRDISSIVKCMKRRISMDPDNFQWVTSLAILRYFEDDDVMALKLLTKAFAVKQNYIPALVTLSLILGHKQAIGYLELALELDPGQKIVHKIAARSCLDCGMKDRALQHFRNMLKLIHSATSDESDLLYIESNMNLQFGAMLRHTQSDLAGKVFLHVLESDRKNGTVKEELRELGQHYNGKKQFDKAVLLFMEVLATDSNCHMAKYELVQLAVKFRENGLREKCFNLLIEILKRGQDYELAKLELINLTLFRFLSEAQAKPEEQVVNNWIVEICDQIRNRMINNKAHGHISPYSLYMLDNKHIRLDYKSAKLIEPQSSIAQFSAPDSKFNSAEAEIWSLGRTLAQMCAVEEEEEVVSDGVVPPVADRCASSLNTLIAQMLSVDPAKRPTLDGILESENINQCLMQDMSGKSLGKPLQRYPLEYRKIKQLGRGEFGVVYLVERRVDKELFAAKEQIREDYSSFARAKEELIMLQQLCHPNIISLVDAFHTHLTTVLIMEHCNFINGDLASYIQRQSATQQLTLHILAQLLNGLEFIHGKEMCHQDLKPEKIVLLPDGAVKMGDFSISKVNLNTSVTIDVETEIYRPPEQQDCDIWALGLIMHEIVTRKKTFRSEDITQNTITDVKDRISNYFPVRLPQSLNRELRYAIFYMLSKNKKYRPSVKSLLELEIWRKSDKQFEGTIDLETVAVTKICEGSSLFPLNCQDPSTYFFSGLSCTPLFTLGHLTPISSPFVPSLEHLDSLLQSRHRLSTILRGEHMRYIQFVFNEKMLCPPEGTYKTEDALLAEQRISSKLEIKKIKLIVKEFQKSHQFPQVQYSQLTGIEIHFVGEEEHIEIKDNRDDCKKNQRNSRKVGSRAPSFSSAMRMSSHASSSQLGSVADVSEVARSQRKKKSLIKCLESMSKNYNEEVNIRFTSSQIKLEQGQKIVSIKVDVDEQQRVPVRISFMIYDCI